MTARLIHYYRYTDYPELAELGFTFNSPVKNSLNTYMANLRHPVCFILPKSELEDIFQDQFSNNMSRYKFEPHEFPELISFFENLDNLCVELASHHSKEWFKRVLDRKALTKHYLPVYTTELKQKPTNTKAASSSKVQVAYCDIQIPDGNTEILDELSDYNVEEETNLMVCIEGIEFYKSTFRWKLMLDSVVDEISDSENEEEPEESEEETAPVFQRGGKQEQAVRNLRSLLDDIKQETNPSSKLNSEMINELAEDVASTASNLPEPSYHPSKLDADWEEMIEKKRQELKEYQKNAERARKAAESLQKKADTLSHEISLHEERISQLSSVSIRRR